MKISIGCDHIVTEIKDNVVKYLQDKGHEVIDNGTYDKVRTHYPIYGKKTAAKVVSGEADLGIVICGTGVGISVSSDKVKGARTALVGNVESARFARETLNANILGMGGRITGAGLMENIIDVFLATEYKKTAENERLIEKIDAIAIDEAQVKDEHLFDEFIEKWDQGGYPAE